MPMPFIDHFSGWEGQTCSYTTDFITKHAVAAKAFGLTEAGYRKGLVKSHWGFIKGKVETGDLPSGTVVLRGVDPNGGQARVVWNGKSFNFDVKKKGEAKFVSGDYTYDAGDIEFSLDNSVWDFTVPTHRKPPVSMNSNSVGALTDEDAAVLFVKTKDDFAKAKGINIKGANPQLDLEVFESLAKQVGYTAEELRLKVEAYKAAGNKLSALKKKVLKNDSVVAKAMAKKKADLPGPPPPAVDKGVKVIDVKEPKVDPPPPAYVEPTSTTVKKAVDDLEAKDEAQTLLYKDEDVVKAYIKAKDELASKVDNKFTLYTQSDEFDEAIFHLMSKDYGIELTGSEIKKHIANYIGSGNKVSVLKKKMAKSGEFTPQADTLKKTKAEKQFDTPPTNSAKEAKSQINEMAVSAEQPVGASGGGLSAGLEQEAFDDLKNSIYKAMSDQNAYDYFAKQAYKMQSKYPDTVVTPLDVIRAYDKKKAAQLGIENGNFYEKRVVEWASTPSGRSYVLSHKAQIQAKAEAEAKQLAAQEAKKAQEEAILKSINDGIPDLPADSEQYRVISTSEARRLQDSLQPWTANEKQGLKHYTGGSYTPMNRYLRGQTSHVSITDRDAINGAMAGMRPVTEPFLVRRGAGYSSFNVGSAGKYGFDATDHAKFKDLIGKTVQEDGFLSTSVGGEGAFGGSVKIEVEIPVGTHGAYVDHISYHQGEREFIVAPGTKFQVLRVHATAGYGGQLNQTVIRLRAIPGSHSTRRH